jgi:hypothetical protein
VERDSVPGRQRGVVLLRLGIMNSVTIAKNGCVHAAIALADCDGGLAHIDRVI